MVLQEQLFGEMHVPFPEHAKLEFAATPKQIGVLQFEPIQPELQRQVSGREHVPTPLQTVVVELPKTP